MVFLFETIDLKRREFLETLLAGENVPFEIKVIPGKHAKYRLVVPEARAEQGRALLKKHLGDVIAASSPLRAMLIAFVILIAAVLVGMVFIK